MNHKTLAAALAGALLLGASGAVAETNRTMIVHKDPNCGCCGAWVDHVRAAGFEVEVRETSLMHEIKAELGVPDDLLSCHSAEVDGYVLEGHVPVSAIEAVLAQRPDVVGVAVPGMPMGSPGMDAPGMAAEPYEVVLFGEEGVRHPLGTFVGAERVER
ncbi:DUF411 domain-containing protein [Salinarimonas ramus]|uniref:Metal-binding protein n=1 Tax=Salinarimonas ramus TaxID=690164 RepID=A0A917QK36_9HYPH|nr:DUF411 domain-containing protein [Salinarimonas ramus]GGK54802.1 metal-binding protein [Salinarimonas ramus]